MIMIKEYDLNCGHDSILTNFLKNRQYGSQGNFPSGNNPHFNNDLKGQNPYKEPNHGPFGGDQQNGFYNEGQFRSVPWRGRKAFLHSQTKWLRVYSTRQLGGNTQ